jgi:hypothetical protein
MSEDIKSLADVGNYVDKLLEGMDYKKILNSSNPTVREELSFEVQTNIYVWWSNSYLAKNFWIINEPRNKKPPYECAGKKYSDIRAAGGKLVETICSELNIENPLTEKIINPVYVVNTPKINYMESFTYNNVTIRNIEDLFNYVKSIIKNDMLIVKEAGELRVHKAEYLKKDGKPKYTKKNTLICMTYFEDENDASFTIDSINNFIRYRFFNKAGLRFIQETEKIIAQN